MGLNLRQRLSAAYQSFSVNPTQIVKGDPPAVAGAGIVRPVPDVMPWGYRYPYGINLSIRPRGTEALSFANLRGIAKNCEMIRLAIQLKKEQIRGLDWDITVRPGFDSKALEGRRKQIKGFFRKPDPLNDLNFNDFVSQHLEDLLVLDAGVLWWIKDRAGRTIGCSSVDGATIRPILTDQGYVPPANEPAYAQIIDGKVHGTYSRDEMLYCQYNPRSDSAYGMSHVEMVVMSAHIWMKRQVSNIALYTEGNVPDHLLIAPPEWGTNQIREVQDYLDAYLSGDVAKKHKLKLIPGGTTLKEVRQQDFTTAFDDWIARIIASVFGVSPHVLFMKTRAGGSGSSNEVVEAHQSDVGFDPFKKYLKETFDEKYIVDRFHEEGLQFSWLSDKDQAQAQNIQKAKTMVPLGAVGIDELRVAEGKAPLGIPNYIQMANGLLFLTPDVIDDIKSGRVNFIDAGGVPHTIQEAASQASAQHEANMAIASGKVDQMKRKPSGPSNAAASKALFDLEIGQFKSAIISDLKKDRAEGLVYRKFVFRFIPEEQAATIRLAAERCSTVEEIKETFGRLNYAAISERENAVQVWFDLEKWAETDMYKWMTTNGFKVSDCTKGHVNSMVFNQLEADPNEKHRVLSEGLPDGVQLYLRGAL